MNDAEPEAEHSSGVTIHVTIPATSSCTTAGCGAAIPTTGVDALTAMAVGGALFALGIVVVTRRRLSRTQPGEPTHLG